MPFTLYSGRREEAQTLPRRIQPSRNGDTGARTQNQRDEGRITLVEHPTKSANAWFKFRRQHQFGNYIADFYCYDAQLVIECDGSIHETNENWQHDQARDAYMFSQGLRVVRFTNEEVLNDTEAVLKKIQEFLDVKC